MTQSTHGGARQGAGRKPIDLPEERIAQLLSQGLSHATLASRFGVSRAPIGRIARKYRTQQ